MKEVTKKITKELKFKRTKDIKYSAVIQMMFDINFRSVSLQSIDGIITIKSDEEAKMEEFKNRIKANYPRMKFVKS